MSKRTVKKKDVPRRRTGGVHLQERADGYRVVRTNEDGVEIMLASITTHRPVPSVVSAENPFGATEYEALDRDEILIHPAGGPISVGDLEQIIDKLPIV